MSAFLAFVEFLVAISVVVTAVSSYLIVNKLWSRKAMREVSESISISAALLEGSRRRSRSSSSSPSSTVTCRPRSSRGSRS